MSAKSVTLGQSCVEQAATRMPIVDEKTGKNERGFYIRTFTGAQFFWDEIETAQIDIRDIAHALAMNCRWTGHTKQFYSVAQHCVYASREAPPGLEMAALLHDASEAYVHDTPSPLKWYLRDHDFTAFKQLEDRIQARVFQVFGVPTPLPPIIKEIDLRLLATENLQLMPGGEEYQHMMKYGSYDWKIRCLPPDQAEAAFLRRFHQINSGALRHARQRQ